MVYNYTRQNIMSRYLTTIPYLASWPTEEHHNNAQDHGKPVKFEIKF